MMDREPGESRAHARCRARVELFQRVLDGDNAEASLLPSELRARRNHWRFHFSPNGKLNKLEGYARLSPNRRVLRQELFFLPLMGFIVVMTIVPMLKGNFVSSPGLIFLLVPIAMFPLMLFARWHTRIVRCLVLSLCPDCEYSLGELPDAIEFSNGERTGPERCPECGAPWPLVPPPAIR